PLEACRRDGDRASCAVRKDAGDDPDVTDGLLIFATVEKTEQGIAIDGGAGIGRVTKPGLDQPVGAAAINSVPRRMIDEAVTAVCEDLGYEGGLRVVISAPGGEEIAHKTFNPMLGIQGGISILGTSGIVEPMSEQAIVDTLALEIRQARAQGARRLILTPGNYGRDYLARELGALEAFPVVKCSNFVGEAIDLCALEGLQEVLLVGHVGKLVKLAGGVMNTHSHVADCRRELFCAHAALCGGSRELCRALMAQVTSDGCLQLLEEAGLREAVMDSLLPEIQAVLHRRAGDKLRIGALLFSNEFGSLGQTETAAELLRVWGEKS
ncbi:MAG: cobalamin biosynthesis protein CbiD, partial [Oscillospiraceae bacterium]|nr:cobalamin biosynthesis protein CbiD [Oscillospiraceae bacterium]